MFLLKRVLNLREQFASLLLSHEETVTLKGLKKPFLTPLWNVARVTQLKVLQPCLLYFDSYLQFYFQVLLGWILLLKIVFL